MLYCLLAQKICTTWDKTITTTSTGKQREKTHHQLNPSCQWQHTDKHTHPDQTPRSHHAYTCAHTRAHTHVHTHTCTHTRAHTRAHTHVHTHTCTHTRAHTHVHTHVHTHARTRAHAHTHTHTHMCKQNMHTHTNTCMHHWLFLSRRSDGWNQLWFQHGPATR